MAGACKKHIQKNIINMHLLNWSKIYWEYTKGLIRKFLCIYLQHLFSLNLNSSAPCLNGLSFICFKPQYLVRSTNLETSQKYNLTIQPLPTYFDFLTFFIDSSCFKDVAKYDCSVFIYLLYRINWWHTPLWWVVLYVSKNCGPEKKSEYPYRYWEVMILSALSTYYILGFIKKTPSRNVFAKTLLNRLSVGCSLSSNETRSDQCLVAAGQRAALCWDWGRGINSPRFRIKHLCFVWAVVMFFQKKCWGSYTILDFINSCNYHSCIFYLMIIIM